MLYDRNEIIEMFAHQAKTFYNKDIDISPYIDEVIQRIDIAFSYSANKYYGNEMRFSPLHGGQYCMFLYYLSKVLSRAGDIEGADVAYCLNKALHSVDMYHGIELPKIYGLEHPVGTVVGRGKFNDFLFLYQGCTIGGNGGEYPTFEDHVIMYSNSKVLGKSHIGKYVMLASNTVVVDQDVPDYSLVFGHSPDIIIKKRDEEEMKKRFTQFWVGEADE